MSVSTDAPERGPDRPADTTSSRTWRSAWRVHFYAGIFSMPILILFSLTGLVILYTDVVNDAQFGDLYRASSVEQTVTLDDQRAAVAEAYPDWSIDSVTPPDEPGRTTVFGISTDEGETFRNAYVDPATGEVTGDLDPGAGLVGLSNRLHGFLNNESFTVPMPVLAGLFGENDGSLTTDMAVGDLALEVFATWGLILAITGLYLWWPRKKDTGRALFVPRLRKKGRARWRDLHAVPGVVLSVLLVFFVATGQPWSAFWGANWSFLASKVTPNEEFFWEEEAPPSEVPAIGTLDRVGNRIPWATRENEIPTSSGSGGAMAGMEGMGGMDGMDGADHGGGDAAADGGAVAIDTPAPQSLDAVWAAAQDEGMLPGSTITFPFDDTADPTAPVFGSYVVMNPWPSDMANQGAVFIDQFTGETLDRSFADQWGAIQWTTEFGVQTHMGTQFGLANRIVMTLACVLILWSAFSALVMFAKRRRSGTGFPRRPVDAKLQRGMIVIAVILAVIYPLWGLSVLAILLLDTFVIRKIPSLRRAFGMKDPTPPPGSGGAAEDRDPEPVS